MARFWSRGENQWRIIPLGAEGATLSASAESPVSAGRGEGPRVVEFGAGKHRQWVLLSGEAGRSTQVRVNGEKVATGVRVLRHRDVICVESETHLFFSSENLPVISVFEGAERTKQCVRCQGDLKAGQQVVICPGCGAIHHQCLATPEAGERLCWTYGETCTCCPQRTPLDADYSWTPEDL